jgi:hypothetical protein
LDASDPTTYEIRLSGRLDARWGSRFEPLTLRHDPDGTTVLSGPIADQAALHGVLQHVRDLGVPLVSVTRKEPSHDQFEHGPNTRHAG